MITASAHVCYFNWLGSMEFTWDMLPSMKTCTKSKLSEIDSLSFWRSIHTQLTYTMLLYGMRRVVQTTALLTFSISA
jgi:hypothetical protein